MTSLLHWLDPKCHNEIYKVFDWSEISVEKVVQKQRQTSKRHKIVIQNTIVIAMLRTKTVEKNTLGDIMKFIGIQIILDRWQYFILVMKENGLDFFCENGQQRKTVCLLFLEENSYYGEMNNK